MTTTDDLTTAAITNGILQGRTAFIGRQVLYCPGTNSTMDVARQLANDGSPEGTIVLTDEQTTGRGRLRRSWVSPPGANILLTVLLRPRLAELPMLTIAASLAVAHAIEETTNLTAMIKWPNDVLVAGRKVCGILLESDVRGETVAFTTVGIGLNVNFDANAFPEIAATATSLMTEVGRPVSRLLVLRSLLQHLENYYLSVRRGEPVHLEWGQRLETIGRWIRVTGVDHIEEGYAEAVDEEGHLLLRRADGTLAQIFAGDVTLRA
ncbi:MAG: biotin--[acetyl-CoA-carboxylase] ligase [Dehalococcoidia bacterium]|nr:biotin--[acetyl-CoA-carboxylase] ligase [Dehalococcoidia bacterium]